MKRNQKYRKFQLHQKNIEALERENSRFRRVYTEYETLNDELWNMENLTGNAVPDDFMEAMLIQSNFLEQEIEDWLEKYITDSAEIRN